MTDRGCASEPDLVSVSLVLPFEWASVARAQRMIGAMLEASRLSPDTVADARIVLAELAGNAIQHGAPTPEGELEVAWSYGAGPVEVTVHDHGQRVVGASGEVLSEVGLARDMTIVGRVCGSWTTDLSDGVRVTALVR
ncbi:ATP-binding protein [Aeromicrobium massiliense]|uniref:ATP-binding protein n=1 Tax=Aeromicrobium massiliense TaxID=1464554 RepID=UPI00031E8DA0|nr:ATP-binding protein [Aeromicrobium massiliense]